jgi:WD40 repeat protein
MMAEPDEAILMAEPDEWKFASTLRAHDQDIRSLVATPAGFVTGSRDNSLCLFSHDGTLLGTKRFNSWVLSLALLHANKLVAGLQDGSCVVVSVSTDGVAGTATWVGHTGPVGSISVSGDLCVSGSWDESARVWDTTTGDCVQALGGHENGVTVLVMQGGALIVTGSSGRWGGDSIVGVTLRLFARRAEAANADGPWVLQARCDGAHAAAIRCLVEIDGAGDGACFASCSNDGLIHLWKAGSQSVEHVARLGCELASFKYVVLPVCAGTLASGDEEGNILLHGRGGDVCELVSIHRPLGLPHSCCCCA